MKTVFVDVDTQLDFLSPSGALYVPGAEAIVDNVARLNRWAESQGILVISDTDAHRENDPEFADWPPHCVAGTLGQQKPAATLLAQRVTVASDAPVPDLSGIAQVILEKQTLDCFGCPNMATLLERLAADRFVVYGVVTEICVAHAAIGLLKWGSVELVTDAVKELDPTVRDRFFAEFTSSGGVLTSVDAVTRS